ncbi:hypothetical protein PTI98_000270 [Pleurotus ostreatus]|nr:hypothetical protein PTI98_000270 [Pleurotus ostreatus]
MVLAELDWREVLCIRATCKSLCSASRSRYVWRAQYQRLSDGYDTPLSAKDSTATYAELERDTLHWARVQRNWVSKSKRPTRRLACKSSAVQLHLLHGGRWLLANGRDPCLDVYDLNLMVSQPCVLIRPPDKWGERVTQYAIDERYTLPNIEVSIALVRQHAYERPGRLSIWKITNTDSDTLVARHITSFNTYTTQLCFAMDLRGDYFARCVPLLSGGRTWYIDVYNWRSSCSLIHRKTTIILNERVDTVRILPGHRILGLGEEDVRIYAIDASDFRPVPGKHPILAGPPAMPLHTLALPGLKPHIHSPLHYDRMGNAHLYLLSAEAVVKFMVPYEDRPPMVVNYMPYTWDDAIFCVLGLHHAFVQTYGNSPKRTAISFARDHGEHCSKTWEAPTARDYGFLLLDDYSGRIIEQTEDNVFLIDYPPT